MKREISAGAVIFRRENRGEVKFLLLYHGRGYWNFPKGHLEQGERALGAFLREVEEETGLKPRDLKVISGFKTTDRYTFFKGAGYDLRDGREHARTARSPVFKIVIFYLVETKKRGIAVSDEHEGFGWFSHKEALRLVKYKNTQNIIEKAYEFIQKSLSSRKAHT